MLAANAFVSRTALLHLTVERPGRPSLPGLFPVDLVLLLVLLASGTAFPQTASGTPPPPETVPRASEERTPPRVSWELTQRTRYTALLNQFRPGLSGDDQALAVRTTLRVEAPLRGLAFVGELQDARAYLTDHQSHVSTTLVAAFDLLQAHLRFGGRTTRAPFVPEFQVGRFSMELGSGRLVAQEVYRDVTRTFTGASARWTRAGRGTLTAFAVLPVLTRPDDHPSLLANKVRPDREHLNLKFWGALYERPLRWPGAHGEAYVYGLDEHDGPGALETRDRALWTAGGRLFRPPAPGTVDVDLEGMAQAGRARATSAPADVRALDVSARYVHASAGYTLLRSWTPRIGLEYDYGGGDADPADGTWGRFDTLFGNRRVDLGPTSIYGALGRENIETVGARLSIAPTPRFDAFAAYRWVGLAAAADAFASTGVRDPTGRSGRDGGRQLDVRVRAWLVPRVLRLESGATYLIAGRFLREAPNATREGNTTFFYSDVTYTLGGK